MYRFELFDVDRVNRRVVCIVRVKYSENELGRVFCRNLWTNFATSIL